MFPYRWSDDRGRGSDKGGDGVRGPLRGVEASGAAGEPEGGVMGHYATRGSGHGVVARGSGPGSRESSLDFSGLAWNARDRSLGCDVVCLSVVQSHDMVVMGNLVLKWSHEKWVAKMELQK